MRVVVKEVGNYGEIRDIKDDLKIYQEIVGGDIETFRLTDDILIVLNENGKWLGLDANFAIPCHGGMEELIVGNVVFVSTDGCDFAGLTDEHIKFLTDIGVLVNKGTSIEVGKPNPFKVGNGMSLIWDENGFLINLKTDNLLPQEIEDFRKGEIRIDVVSKAGVIFFIIEIQGSLGISDIAFNALVSPNKEEDLIEPTDKLGYGVHMILTEGRNNEVKAMRVLGLNAETSKVLYKLIKEQFEKKLPKGMFEHNVADIQNRYSTKDLRKFSLAYSKFEGKK